MSRRKTSIFLMMTLLCGAALVSRPASSRGSASDFSSVYTDLSKDCKAALKHVGEGQDMPLRCKGYGGYEVFIDYSAMSAHLRIQSAGGEEVVSLPPQPLDYYSKRKLEWRLVQGKPFAVIIRVDRYRDEGGSIDVGYYDRQNKMGEYLRVAGLKGSEFINDTIDAGTPNANAEARALADRRYTSGK
jgi:hypothetical protein